MLPCGTLTMTDAIARLDASRRVVRQVPVEDNGKIRCDACPVLCWIKDGRSGACDRYANEGGLLVRVDPWQQCQEGGDGGEAVALIPFVAAGDPSNWNGDLLAGTRSAATQASGSITAVGATTTYPDYKPAPFVVASRPDGVDLVTVVTEGIFSYCGVKVKIDTDRHIGEERAAVRHGGEVVGHVTTGEYGSRMLSLGGVDQLTGGSKKQGRLTCEALLGLCNREAVTLSVDEGAELVVQSGRAPIIDGERERLMRVGCGSATIGMFARQWAPHVDEVVVVDDHITGVLSEHQAGVLLDLPPSGIRIRGAKSTPGRYFRVAEPGGGWGGTDIQDPLSIIERFKPDVAWPGLRLLMVSTTGEQHAYFVLDDQRQAQPAELPEELVGSVARIAENCEPSLCTVLFMGGAGGSLRAGVTDNPIALTRSVKHALTRVTIGGIPAYVWPGGGITVMADVADMPANAFGSVPTPALVAPIEFTMRREDFLAMGGELPA